MTANAQQETTSFGGFPAEGLHFMQELAVNNERAWFDAHKQTYLDAVQAPAVALVQALGTRLQERFPSVHYDMRTNGSGSLMRIHRDVRFSADKSPYKTNIAMMFPTGTGKKTASPGFGLQLTLTGVDVMAGIFDFDKDALVRYRSAVDDDRTGEALVAAAATVEEAGPYSIQGQHYRRVPSGYAADHPRADWLKYKGLWATGPEIDLRVAQTPQLVDVAMGHFKRMAPIFTWLISSVYL